MLLSFAKHPPDAVLIFTKPAPRRPMRHGLGGDLLVQMLAPSTLHCVQLNTLSGHGHDYVSHLFVLLCCGKPATYSGSTLGSTRACPDDALSPPEA